MPLGPDLPNGVRTPSTKTTSRARIVALAPWLLIALTVLCYSPVTSAGTVLAQKLLQLLQRPGVDDVVRGQPAALRGAHAVLHVLKVAERVRVGVDRELHARVPGLPDVVARQVEARGRGVDLERGAGARAGLEQLPQVDVDRRAAADLAGQRVADDVHVGVL